MIAWMRGLLAPLRSNGVIAHMHLAQLQKDLQVIREFLLEVDGKLDLALKEERTRPVAVASSVDERISEAASSTAVFVAMHSELGDGWDQRTIRGKVERLIAVHSLQDRYPLGSRDVDLAKYLAERMPDGRFRIQHAVEALA
jgi:hypothetical protein